MRGSVLLVGQHANSMWDAAKELTRCRPNRTGQTPSPPQCIMLAACSSRTLPVT
jgi:hypothetical protein